MLGDRVLELVVGRKLRGLLQPLAVPVRELALDDAPEHRALEARVDRLGIARDRAQRRGLALRRHGARRAGAPGPAETLRSLPIATQPATTMTAAAAAIAGMRNRSKALSRSARPSRNARSTRRPPERVPPSPASRPAWAAPWRCRGWAGEAQPAPASARTPSSPAASRPCRAPHEVRGPQVAARDEHAQLGVVGGRTASPSRAMYHWISVSVPVMAVSRADAQTALCSRISRVLTGDGRHFRSPRRGSSIASAIGANGREIRARLSTGWLTSSKHQKVAFSKALRVRQAAGTCAVGVM